MKKKIKNYIASVMTRLNVFRKAMMVVALGLLGTSAAFAQLDKYKDYKEVYRDTTESTPKSRVLVQKDTLFDAHRVVTNSFEKNWFIYGTAGAHTFRGDYSNLGKFGGTISPDFSLGIGKWFTPGIAAKFEVTYGTSRGYSQYPATSPYGSNICYGYGDWISEPGTGQFDGYRKAFIRWIDFAGIITFNLTRLLHGYEGYNSPRLMNQLMLNLGIGGEHHMGYGNIYSSSNQWSGHAELQYSRFFNPRKRVSLDLKARALVYQTNFDGEFGFYDYAAQHFDSNLGLDVGFTFYLGKSRSNGWSSGTSTVYRSDYREREIQVVKVKEVEPSGIEPAKSGTITFFVFYPNNYSGRNDAPNIPGAEVNAIEYLAGGIFTQKVYDDSDAVAARLSRNQSLDGLAFSDLPTEPANRDFDIDFIPRGYEMLNDTPLSLSLKAEDMNAFKDKAGFYYAPIYDGLHTWNYRIDDATLRQKLVSDKNYLETATFGLNAHSGLDVVASNMEVDGNEMLVSFADVYAALNSNEGYVSKFTDPETVEYIKSVLDQRVVLLIQVEGLATSQDNFSGSDAVQVGLDRNNALAQNRSETVINWLKGYDEMSQTQSQLFIVGNMNRIGKVTDKSTRGLSAKLNRCVKVKIHYVSK